EGDRSGLPRREDHPCCHRPCLLQRRSALGHQGRRYHRRSHHPTYRQRTHRRSHRLRSRQELPSPTNTG
ncbi:hypothetical protein FRC00_000425, partial [Tulasnella sp. 408]